MKQFKGIEWVKKIESVFGKTEYNFEEIADLEAPIYSLVKKFLKEPIDKGEYNVLISDDASGRIPTLVFREIILNRLDKLHPDLKPEERNKLLQTYFVAGGIGGHFNKDAIENFFKNIALGDKDRALLITEFMSSGRSMAELTNDLERAGIQFDVAVLGMDVSSSEEWYREKYPEMFARHKFYMNNASSQSLSIWAHSELAGVRKKSLTSAHAEPVVKFGSSDYTQENIIKAREDVDKLAKVILKKVW